MAVCRRALLKYPAGTASVLWTPQRRRLDDALVPLRGDQWHLVMLVCEPATYGWHWLPRSGTSVGE